MKIARWVEESNGNWVWVCQDCKLATVSATEHGTWESQWYSAEWGSVTFGEEFHSAEDACLATEIWTASGEIVQWMVREQGRRVHETSQWKACLRTENRTGLVRCAQ
jgi:hypothetical protein